MKYIICFIVLYFISGILKSQHKCSSLQEKLFKEKSDTIKLRLLVEIGNCFYLALEPDSAEKYYDKALEFTEKLINKYSKLSQLYLFKTTSLRKKGDIKFDLGQYDNAINYYRQALDLAIKKGLLSEISTCYNNIAILYHHKSLYDSAIFYYFKSLKIDEQTNDLKGISARYNNIGNVYFVQKSYDRALEYYQKSLEIKEKQKDTSGISSSYLNIGAVLYSQAKFDKAIEYFQKSLELKQKINDIQGVILVYNNIGLIYRKQHLFDKAIEYYQLSLEMATKIRDKQKMAMIYENIASVYYYIAKNTNNLTKAREYYLKAIENSKKSFEISKELKLYEYMNSSSGNLYRTYFALGEFKKGIEYLEIYMQTKDSLFNKNKIKAIAEAEKKFESEKKQLIIENLTKDKELQASELKRQKLTIWAVAIGLVMSVIFSFFMVQRFRITRKQKKIIEKQKAIVDEKNVLLNKQNEEIKTQHEIVVRQKEHIEEMHKKLTDSINYAQRIQEAIFPEKNIIKQLLGKHFIIFKPKDIVSGDFYWTTQINEWLIIAVADCTGHGVPGAFMSILGVSLLNEIVHKKEVTKASQALNLLRDEIIYALRQQCMNAEQKDGMDISLFVINTNTKECQWAGANNPLLILRKNSESKTWQLDEIKPDKMPIAVYPKMNPFTNHEFTIESETRIYLFTDGYADQFGHKNGKKFKHANFKNLLLKTANLPLNEQHEILDKTIEEWKGNLEQTDDITVVCVEF